MKLGQPRCAVLVDLIFNYSDHAIHLKRIAVFMPNVPQLNTSFYFFRRNAGIDLAAADAPRC